jgi:hypothetical protein
MSCAARTPSIRIEGPSNYFLTRISKLDPVIQRRIQQEEMMLGEKIGEISGKVTMQRVLPNLGGDPKMETSFQATGSVLGTNINDTGTYWTIVRPDGTQYGEGQGVMMTRDGKVATWTGHGVGVRSKDGSATYRGALYFQTMPPRWSRLNKVAVLFEYAVDAEGNTHSEYWEWK